ncbi:hypothetical protein GCM10017779_58470 [Streptomyces capillispiralis]|nr:hypothetical protein GCM10017779_58470 [Streptomyces capillispiralis]
MVDETGTTLWSKKIDYDETAILVALGEILDLADEVRWSVDISGTASVLLIALLASHSQQAVYVPGRTVNRMAGAYRGEAKTDARDAYVIAETARHRQDFATIDVPAQLATDLARDSRRVACQARCPRRPCGRRYRARGFSGSANLAAR